MGSLEITINRAQLLTGQICPGLHTESIKISKKVDVVKVKNGAGWTPGQHHAVEEEGTHKLLFECETQKKAIDWTVKCGFSINVHRERNRKPRRTE
jgi:hypothetical protein